MSGRRGDPPPGPDKPVSEMTAEEVAEFRRELRRELREMERPRRERALRAGRGKPRSRAEWDIFASDLLKDRRGATSPREPQGSGEHPAGNGDATS